jgi:hypothetical protein
MVPFEDDGDKQLELADETCALCEEAAVETAFFARSY